MLSKKQATTKNELKWKAFAQLKKNLEKKDFSGLKIIKFAILGVQLPNS